MNKPWVRIVMALAVGALIGSVAMVAPERYESLKFYRALRADMKTNPAYVARDYVETRVPEMTVLNVLSPHESKQGNVIMWIYIGPSPDTADYFYATMKICLQAMKEAWPTARGYMVKVAYTTIVSTIDGPKRAVRALAQFWFITEAASAFIEEPTGEVLAVLSFRRGYRAARAFSPLRKLLPRLPGYVWPWDITAVPKVTPTPCQSCGE